jgi:hypothetical protein
VPAGAITNPTGRPLTYSILRQDGSAAPGSFNASTGHLTWTIASSSVDRDIPVTIKATDATDGMSVSVNTDISVTANMGGGGIKYAVPAGRKAAVASSSTTTAMAMAPQTMAPQTITTQTASAPLTPNLQSYWFTYDADNRAVVNNGALSNGQIGVIAGAYQTPSYANQYDAAGNVVLRNTVNGTTYTLNNGRTTTTYYGGDTMSQRLVYDARNELVQTDHVTDLSQHEASLGAQQRTVYDADGRQQVVENSGSGLVLPHSLSSVISCLAITGSEPNGTYFSLFGWPNWRTFSRATERG